MKTRLSILAVCLLLPVLMGCLPTPATTTDSADSPTPVIYTPYATFTPVPTATSVLTQHWDSNLRLIRLIPPTGYFRTFDLNGNVDDEINFSELSVNAIGTETLNLAWSPDFRELAFLASNFCESPSSTINCTQKDGNGIFLLDWESKSLKLIIDAPVDSNPAWSPDGKYIAFVSSIESTDAESGYYSIISIYERATGSIREIFRVPDVTIPYISWSPNGEWIAFLKNRKVDNATHLADPCVLQVSKDCRTLELDIIHPDGSRLTNLLNNVWEIESKFDHNIPTWSHDGRWLAVTKIENFEKYIFMLNLETGEEVQPLLPSGIKVFSYPVWSPRDDFFVFEGIDDNTHHIYRFDLKSKNVIKLTSIFTDAQYPSLSPDGGLIKFVSDSSFYIMKSDGASAVKIANINWSGIDSYIWFIANNK